MQLVNNIRIFQIETGEILRSLAINITYLIETGIFILMGYFFIKDWEV